MAQTNLNITATFDGAQARRGLKDLELAGLRVGDAIDTGNKMAVRALGRMLAPLLLIRTLVGVIGSAWSKMVERGKQLEEAARSANMTASAFSQLRAQIIAVGGAAEDFNREIEALKSGKTTLEAIAERWRKIRAEGKTAAQAAEDYNREMEDVAASRAASASSQILSDAWDGFTKSLGIGAAMLINPAAMNRSFLEQMIQADDQRLRARGETWNDQRIEKIVQYAAKEGLNVQAGDFLNPFRPEEERRASIEEHVRNVLRDIDDKREANLDKVAFNVWKGLNGNLAETTKQLQRIKGFEQVGEDTVRARVERHRERTESDVDRAVRLGKEALDAAAGVAEGPAPGALSFGWTAGGGAIQGVNYPGFSIKQETAVDVLKEAADAINAELQQVRTITLSVEEIAKALRGEL